MKTDVVGNVVGCGMVVDSRIQDIAEAVASGRGYRGFLTTVERTAAMKWRWSETDGNLVLGVSDYLLCAPDAVMRDLLDGAVASIRGGTPMAYTPLSLEWLNSTGFSGPNQAIYLDRCGVEPDGRLGEVLEGLEDAGLVDSCEGVVACWSPESMDGGDVTSTLMRVAMVPSSLNRPEVPPAVLEFILCAGVRSMGRWTGERVSADRFDEMMGDFPGIDGVLDWLADNGFSGNE